MSKPDPYNLEYLKTSPAEGHIEQLGDEHMVPSAKAKAAMNYPRCRTCKWWGPYDGHPGDIGPGWGVCSRFRDFWENSADQAMVINQFATDGQLSTAPDFGCVQHEPRPDGGE